MSLQQDIRNSFGQSNYFENKDQLRQEVNEFIRGKRTEKAIGRNLRKGFRAKIGSKENNAAMQLYDAAIKMGIVDPDGGGGFGMEAGRARKFAEFTLNKNFEEEQKRKRELEARTQGALPAAGQQNAGVQTVIGADGIPRDIEPQANVVNAQQGQDKPVLVKPDWAKDVEKDKTFPKGFFDNPDNLARIQGKSRAEVAEMLNKAKAARFMAGATARGDALRDKELGDQTAVRAANLYNQQEQFDKQVSGKVDEAISQAGKSVVKKSMKLPDGTFASGLSTTDLDALRDAQQFVDAYNKDASSFLNITSEANKTLEPLSLGLGFDMTGKLSEKDANAQKLVEELNANLVYQDEGFQSPSVDYYSMSTEDKLADFQKRNELSKKLGDTRDLSEIPFMYEFSDGKIQVIKNPDFKKSRETKKYQNLLSQKNNLDSKLVTNARNQVISEAQKKQQKINEQLQQRDQYRQQRIEQEKMLNEAYSLFR